MNIVKLAMQYKQVPLSIFGILVLAGVYSLLFMQRSEDPEIPVKQGIVIAFLPGASAEEMEEQVSKKIEEHLFQYKEIRKGKTFSTTSAGRVVVQVELENWFPAEEKDIFWSKLQLGLAAFTRELPQGVLGPIVNGDFGETTALMLGISSDELSYAQLKDYLDLLNDDLKTIPEVAKIQLHGLQDEQITIQLDPTKLSQYGIGLNQMAGIIQQQNNTAFSGELEMSDSRVELFTRTRFNSLEELGNQIVYYHPNGSLVRLKDVATIQREYEDMRESIQIDGKKTVMLAVEMQPGNNIVIFGETIDEKIARLVEEQLPASVEITQIYSQPHSVDHAISHFLREFAIAIGAVILVVMILLPLRMATISAIASPVSILITLAVMQLMGLGLHSVTLAAMIVVLGMVVDDAIIIVDNYVEKLDEGLSTWEAAWKSATQLFVPILTATLTIIFAFLPLGIVLEGTSGDFIQFMPYTVAIALTTSFIVAIFLTPYLCYLFIKKGLHSAEDTSNKKPSFLDHVQRQFDRLVETSFKYGRVTIVAGVLSIVAGLFAMTKVSQEFFPKLNRSTFNLEVWLPEGSTFEMTEQAVDQLYKHIKDDERIKNISTFTGTSSPRFFTSYAPEAPAQNYAQLFINTHTVAGALELIDEYQGSLANFLPEGDIHIKQLSYQNTKTPLEIRVIGEDIDSMRYVANQLMELIKDVPGGAWIHTDYKNPFYAMNVKVDAEKANRLGISSTALGQTLGAALSGAPISTYWEGDKALDIVMRLPTEDRDSFDDILNLYVTGQTGINVPLRQVASVAPAWDPGVIVRRNGLRTLTVRAETNNGVYASDILKEIQPAMATIDLPKGIEIGYGGDLEGAEENMPNMMFSLLISLTLIFLTLMFQFKSLTKTFIILMTFPLSILGGATGLLITGNPFGFTAFIGIISLIGIVVRNGIVLVDYADELIRDHAYSIKDAAIAASKRRMRPIFLTSSAAAIGVVPMIIGKSPMWSPLASVLAVGLMVSMFMTLFVIPVLYYKWVKPEKATEPELQVEEVLVAAG